MIFNVSTLWYIQVQFEVYTGTKMNILFEPSKIGSMSLGNRFVRSATWEGMAEDDGQCSVKLIELMTGLTEGGVGLIVTGHAYVHQYGRLSSWQLGIDRDALIPSLQSMTQKVHENEGKIAVQLGSGGAYLSKSRLRTLPILIFKRLSRLMVRRPAEQKLRDLMRYRSLRPMASFSASFFVHGIITARTCTVETFKIGPK